MSQNNNNYEVEEETESPSFKKFLLLPESYSDFSLDFNQPLQSTRQFEDFNKILIYYRFREEMSYRLREVSSKFSQLQNHILSTLQRQQQLSFQQIQNEVQENFNFFQPKINEFIYQMEKSQIIAKKLEDKMIHQYFLIKNIDKFKNFVCSNKYERKQFMKIAKQFIKINQCYMQKLYKFNLKEEIIKNMNFNHQQFKDDLIKLLKVNQINKVELFNFVANYARQKMDNEVKKAKVEFLFDSNKIQNYNRNYYQLLEVQRDIVKNYQKDLQMKNNNIKNQFQNQKDEILGDISILTQFNRVYRKYLKSNVLKEAFDISNNSNYDLVNTEQNPYDVIINTGGCIDDFYYLNNKQFKQLNGIGLVELSLEQFDFKTKELLKSNSIIQSKIKNYYEKYLKYAQKQIIIYNKQLLKQQHQQIEKIQDLEQPPNKINQEYYSLNEEQNVNNLEGKYSILQSPSQIIESHSNKSLIKNIIQKQNSLNKQQLIRNKLNRTMTSSMNIIYMNQPLIQNIFLTQRSPQQQQQQQFSDQQSNENNLLQCCKKSIEAHENIKLQKFQFMTNKENQQQTCPPQNNLQKLKILDHQLKSVSSYESIQQQIQVKKALNQYEQQTMLQKSKSQRESNGIIIVPLAKKFALSKKGIQEYGNQNSQKSIDIQNKSAITLKNRQCNSESKMRYTVNKKKLVPFNSTAQTLTSTDDITTLSIVSTEMQQKQLSLTNQYQLQINKKQLNQKSQYQSITIINQNRDQKHQKNYMFLKQIESMSQRDNKKNKTYTQLLPIMKLNSKRIRNEETNLNVNQQQQQAIKMITRSPRNAGSTQYSFNYQRNNQKERLIHKQLMQEVVQNKKNLDQNEQKCGILRLKQNNNFISCNLNKIQQTKICLK